MFVSNIIDEAKQILGTCDLPLVYRRISDAVKLANNQAKFDISLGQMDLCVCDGCITLPPDVGTVLGVINGGWPTLLRDQWFQYHANGPGIQSVMPWFYTDELGYFTTFRDPPGECKLVAEVENAKDSNSLLRVFGWDKNGKRIFTEGANGILEDGFLVPTVFDFSIANPNAPLIVKIDKIHKALTNGFIKLIAVDKDTGVPLTQIGYYQPWETVPLYRRLRAGNGSWLRIKYKKKDLEVRSDADWINIESRLALLFLLKAVKYGLDNQFETSTASHAAGMKLLSDEAESLRVPGLDAPQVTFAEGIPASQMDVLFY